MIIFITFEECILKAKVKNRIRTECAATDTPSNHQECSRNLHKERIITQIEALRECRPPCPRQIITPILPIVKMLSLGGERLPPTPQKKKRKKAKKMFWIITCTTIWVYYHHYGAFLLIYSS